MSRQRFCAPSWMQSPLREPLRPHLLLQKRSSLWRPPSPAIHLHFNEIRHPTRWPPTATMLVAASMQVAALLLHLQTLRGGMMARQRTVVDCAKAATAEHAENL